MGDAVNRTSIEWTDYTTNLIRYRDPEGRSVHGCIKVSAGCANCYASAWSARGLTGERGGAFTAKRQATLTPSFDEAEGKRILRTKVTGKRVFVGDMTDVFGEWVPDALLDRMFAVFALRPDLTFQVLTKRPERMREYFPARGVRQ
jgi:protein gp37